MSDNSEKIVYLMRGLPSTGKSFSARRLAGSTGVVLETDEYFLTQVGEDPTRYDYQKSMMPVARKWNFERFMKAVDEGVSPIVVDRGNALSGESHHYAVYAHQRGYRLELREPESPWWQEIRVLLKYKKYTKPVLDQWAEELARRSKPIHQVSASTIRKRIEKWKWDVTIEDILHYEPSDKKK